MSQPDMAGWSLDQIRQYAETASQADGTATVLVVLGQVHEFVIPSMVLDRYHDDVTGALVEALRRRQEHVMSRPDLRLVPPGTEDG